jgi:hypothetical protein
VFPEHEDQVFCQHLLTNPPLFLFNK